MCAFWGFLIADKGSNARGCSRLSFELRFWPSLAVHFRLCRLCFTGWSSDSPYYFACCSLGVGLPGTLRARVWAEFLRSSCEFIQIDTSIPYTHQPNHFCSKRIRFGKCEINKMLVLTKRWHRSHNTWNPRLPDMKSCISPPRCGASCNFPQILNLVFQICNDWFKHIIRNIM